MPRETVKSTLAKDLWNLFTPTYEIAFPFTHGVKNYTCTSDKLRIEYAINIHDEDT